MGDTWTIRVISEDIGEPTDLTLVDRSSSDFNVSHKIKQSNEEAFDLSPAKTMAKGITAMNVSLNAIESYNHFIGKNAQANQLSRVQRYANYAIGGAIAGGLVGAIAGVGVAVAKEQFDYKMERVEANAYAEYLKQQSGTSVNNSQGDFYKWNIF